MAKSADFSGAVWDKSSTSGDGDCVEVAKLSEAVGVRDSQDRSGPILVFTRSEWRAFLEGVREGEFDV